MSAASIGAGAAAAALAYLCQECGRGCDGAIRCPGCGALAFCCDQHRAAHCGPAGGRHSAEDCARMAGQLARPLATVLPFPPWASKVRRRRRRRRQRYAANC
jgi:hypothetical protein